jgi:AraC-like DNA-binding protein
MKAMLPTVRAVSLTNYAEVARFVGLDPYAMLREARIAPDALVDPETRLPARAVVDLFAASAERSGCASFGLLMAECRTFASLGPISLLLEHQPTVRAMIHAMMRFVRHFSDIFRMSLDDDGETAFIGSGAPAGIAERQVVEYTVAITFRSLGEALRGRWQPDTIYFPHAAPENLADHRRVLQCAIRFNAPRSGFACRSKSLDIANPRSDALMAGHAERLLGLVPMAKADSSIAERIRHSLYLLLPEGHASVERVAINLGLHPRTLQRMIEKKGGSFASLLNDVRRELAQRYLAAPHHSIAAVSLLTGYSSQSAFSRWFVGEFGERPAVWREDHRVRPDAGRPASAA